MVVGIGCDVLHIDRVERLLKYGKFLNKYFTINERNLFNENIYNEKNYLKKIASNLCVKEAFFKAVSEEIDSFRFIDVEVIRDSNGKPYVNLYNNLKKFNNYKVHVTISNERNIVTSFIIVEKVN